MKKDYWKECCLLLIGLIFGCLYQKYIGETAQTSKGVVVIKDTIVIRDTILSKATIPPLCKENVLAELKRQNVHHTNIVLAQSIHETGKYKSKICKTHNNIFGIRKNNKYKKYNNWTESVTDYKKSIQSRYRKGEDYYAFIQRIGYAEDYEYINKIKKYI